MGRAATPPFDSTSLQRSAQWCGKKSGGFLCLPLSLASWLSGEQEHREKRSGSQTAAPPPAQTAAHPPAVLKYQRLELGSSGLDRTMCCGKSARHCSSTALQQLTHLSRWTSTAMAF